MSLTADQAIQVAVQHHQAGRVVEAVAIYQKILARQPNHVDALHLLGVAAMAAGMAETAADLIGRTIAIRPDLAEFHSNLGNAFKQLHRMADAAAAYRRAVQLKPNSAEVWNNLGTVLLDIGQRDEAIEAYRHALQLNPRTAEAHHNLGLAMFKAGRFEAAGESYATALRLEPNFVAAHWSLAALLLLRGDFARGWAEYEWRMQLPEFRVARDGYTQPRWDAGQLKDRTILLHAEQGFGDAIQFIRYAPMVADRGGRIIVSCMPELVRLFAAAPGISQIVATGAGSFDVQCPLVSLPLAFGTRLESIPSQVPYLFADPALAQTWSGKLRSPGARLKVGLAWAGRCNPPNNRHRSTALSEFARLVRIHGVDFYSLQKSDGAISQSAAVVGFDLIDLTADIHDFADTAALISHLDLVISIDTAVAHLAGAMGKPTWVLLMAAPDWRWLLERDDSPWYPTMRLFRQRRSGDWGEVIERVAEALMELAKITAEGGRISGIFIHEEHEGHEEEKTSDLFFPVFLRALRVLRG